MLVRNISKFNEYRCVKQQRSSNKYVRRAIVKQDNPIIAQLFAPDPNTGLPSSDLAYILKADCNPEIAAFIQQNLMSPVEVTSGIDDANKDLAIQCIRGKDEDFVSYAERIKGILNPCE